MIICSGYRNRQCSYLFGQLIGGENTSLAQMAKCLGIPAAAAAPNEPGNQPVASEKPTETNGDESCEQQEEKTSQQDDVKLLEDILVKLICDGECHDTPFSAIIVPFVIVVRGEKSVLFFPRFRRETRRNFEPG